MQPQVLPRLALARAARPQLDEPGTGGHSQHGRVGCGPIPQGEQCLAVSQVLLPTASPPTPRLWEEGHAWLCWQGGSRPWRPLMLIVAEELARVQCRPPGAISGAVGTGQPELGVPCPPSPSCPPPGPWATARRQCPQAGWGGQQVSATPGGFRRQQQRRHRWGPGRGYTLMCTTVTDK